MRSSRLAVAVFAGLALSAGGLASPAFSSGPEPPGSGALTVDRVGCVFRLDFSGYGEGDLFAAEFAADVTFELVPPSGSDVLLTDQVFIGEDPAGGSDDLDASHTYDLTEVFAGIEPQPTKGFHVRLTVHAEGTKGADTKRQLFWVSRCRPVCPYD